MNREQELAVMEQAAREAWATYSQDDAQPITIKQQDDDEDWPLLTFLFGGLALALVANTFIGLIPG